MGEVRTRQQSGWVTRIFDDRGEGRVKVTTVPVPECAEDREVGVWVPRRNEVSEAGEKLLTAMLGRLRARWEWHGDGVGGGADGTIDQPHGNVYRILVGKAAIESWVDLPLKVMAGRIAYHPAMGRVVAVLPHPDSVLADRANKKRIIADMGGMLDTFGQVVRGELSAVDAIARDCVLCAASEHPETQTRWHVTEIDRNGLGLCREHSGYDLRPEEQRFVQEGLFG